VSGGAVEPAPIPDDPEDVKLITLARAALGRTGAAQGAAVRDTDGRAYAAASVHLEHLELSAVAVAVAMAVSSGADGLEAVAVAGAPASENDLDLLHDLPGSGVAVWSVDAIGQVLDMSQLLTASAGCVSQHSRQNDPEIGLSGGCFAAQPSKRPQADNS
jgi:hypothetical protein